MGRVPELPTEAMSEDQLRELFDPPAEETDGEETNDSEETTGDEELDEEENDTDIIPEKEFFGPEEELKEGASDDLSKTGGYTVDGLIKVLKRYCKPDDKLLCLTDKKECFIFDVYSKNDTATIELHFGSPKAN